jgi:hypothetical protein
MPAEVFLSLFRRQARVLEGEKKKKAKRKIDFECISLA